MSSYPDPRPRPEPRSTTVAVTVAVTNLRRLGRDRTSLFFIVVLPVVVITLIGVALPDGGNAPAERPLGVAAAEGTQALVDALDGDPQIEAHYYDDRAALARAVRRESVAGGVVLDAAVGQALTSRPADPLAGEPAGLAAGPAPGTPPSAGAAADVEFLSPPGREPPVALRQRVATVIAAHSAGMDADEDRTVAVEQRLAGNAADAAAGDGSALPGGFDYTAPSNLVLFVFINTLVSAGLFAESRELGVLRRAGGAPVRRGAVLAGEVLSRLVVGLGQAGFILALGSVVFGVEWGEPLAVAAIVGLFALAATGAAMVLAVGVRRDATIAALAPPLGIALGMLGGTMWPLEIVGDPMRIAGHLTPHAWAMDAFIATIGGGAGVGDLALELGALAAFAVVLLGAAAVLLARRPLEPAR